MKVSKCSDVKTIEPKRLTWNDMKSKEGVYRIADDASCVRLIVVVADTVLWYNGDVLVKPSGYENHFFYRTNESVCFELKLA